MDNTRLLPLLAWIWAGYAAVLLSLLLLISPD